MSGIIGGAGSKSGVIGTTELIHEIGGFNWQMVGSTGGPEAGGGELAWSQFNDSASYHRIGNLVFCTMGGSYIRSGQKGNYGGSFLCTGLPFTSVNTGSGGSGVGHSTGTIGSFPDAGVDAAMRGVRVANAGTTVTFSSGAKLDGTVLYSAIVGGYYLTFSCYYTIA